MLVLATGLLIIAAGALLAAAIQLASRRRERDYAMEETARMRQAWLAADRRLAEACTLLEHIARNSTIDIKDVNNFLRNGST